VNQPLTQPRQDTSKPGESDAQEATRKAETNSSMHQPMATNQPRERLWRPNYPIDLPGVIMKTSVINEVHKHIFFKYNIFDDNFQV